MNTQDDIMKALWDNENALQIANLLHNIVMPAISKMPEDQPIEARARFIIGERITVEMVMKNNKQSNNKEEQK